jgi:beta-lactamase superfamily II metal-dependent hydrolase
MGTGTRIHFLNVEDGDCTIIENFQTGRHSVIDICCGNYVEESNEEDYDEDEELALEALFSLYEKPKGNFNQKSHPTNPVDYISDLGIKNIFRFILTHPDMDHMDGLKNLFRNNTVNNFWHTGVERDAPDFPENGKYKKADWDYYTKLIEKQITGVNVISPKAGAKNKYWSFDENGDKAKGDSLSILSPTDALVKKCNYKDFNDASYVISYKSSAGPVIFPGDSGNAAWAYILEYYKSLVKDAAVLFAPHHGRDSKRDWAFLDVVNPRISFLGNASSEHLGYEAWKNRDLLYFTNNQCGNIRVDFDDEDVVVSIENEDYARKYTDDETDEIDGYWFLTRV